MWFLLCFECAVPRVVFVDRVSRTPDPELEVCPRLRWLSPLWTFRVGEPPPYSPIPGSWNWKESCWLAALFSVHPISI